MINFQGVVKAPISFEVTLKPVGMSRKVKRIAPECVYLLTASDRDAALQLAAQTHRYNQQGGSMNTLLNIAITMMVIGAIGMIGAVLINFWPRRQPAETVVSPTAIGRCERCRHGAMSIQHPLVACDMLGRHMEPTHTCANWS